MQRFSKLFLVQILMILMLASTSFAGSFNDNDAMAGLKQGKLLFDINLKNDKAMILYLQVIKKTHADIAANGLTPDIILAFRGMAVEFIKTDYAGLSNEQINTMKSVGLFVIPSSLHKLDILTCFNFLPI